MTKWMIPVLLALFVLPCAHAGIGVFGSGWDSKDYDSLYGGGIQLGTGIGGGFGIAARASYLSTDLFNDHDLQLEVIPLEAVASWTLDMSEMLKPYVGAGIGYYIKNLDWEADEVWDDAKAKDCVGYFALAGLNLALGNATLFGEAKYNLISDDDEFEWRGSNVHATYSLDGLSVNAGLKFGF